MVEIIDLFLDCAVYNGHSTTLDILRAGSPIVTLKGHRFHKRVASSISWCHRTCGRN
jgi:predicted O-linked N-acetylglucosamine transferase (SPINDLY family)